MISVADALARVISSVKLLSVEQVSLDGALGRVLAEDVAARVSHPPVAVSSMDGYAVRAEDLAANPATLKVIGEAAAGHGFGAVIGAGQAARIFTGAPLPAGADAVVMQEDCERSGDQVTVGERVDAGRFIRPAGLDFREGQILLHSGLVLTARQIGLAAAMNVPWLMVRRKPRIAYLATGNEVVMPGDPLRLEQIISSNSLALGAYIRVLGGIPVNLGIAGDDTESLDRLLAGASQADILVTIGGVSVGDYDLVRKVLDEKGMELGFHRVAMRPGKPVMFGCLGTMAVLGLPGNPVSAGVTTVVFLKAAVEAMLGIGGGGEPMPTALLGRDLIANDQRQEYLRANLGHDADGNLVATPFTAQDSAMMARFAAADCLIVRPPLAAAAKAGARVEIISFRHGL
ncbi:MAG TPA: gephyrin-like molybdotransferase Glp [Rhodospirillales bacterium]|jgi:molybdopterin molybdotransferase|nr:gephyrin-like molybdotransferase Glp [Rhodospirillales bacterium]